MKLTKEQSDAIDIIVKENGAQYNLHKAAEECQELGLVLTQKLLKPDKVKDQEIIDEIGDVIIRIEMLKRIYPMEAIQARVDYKLGKYKEYKDHKKYKNI